MTRKEALSKVSLSVINGERESFIASLEALGLIKFEEEKKTAAEIISSYSCYAAAILGALAVNGYEIVKKNAPSTQKT